MRSPRVLAVDIGASHSAAGIFSVGASGRLVLQEFAFEQHSSDPAQESRWLVEVARSLGAVAARHKLNGAAAIAVPGHLALTKFIKTPSVAKEKRHKIVAFEAAEAIPHPLEEVVWDHVVIADDGFDLDVMLTAVKFDAMQALCGASETAGFPVERATPATLALCRAFRYNYPQPHDCVIVVNVGARTTNILFFESLKAVDYSDPKPAQAGARPPHADRFYIRTLALAGNAVTQAIADELRIEFAAAEALKIQVLSGRSDLPAGSPSRAAVHRAAAQFASRLQMEIVRSAVNYRRQSGNAAPTAVYLAGGGSLLDELPGLLGEKLKLPVLRYEALKNVDLSANARAAGAESVAPALADLVGLATRLVDKHEPDASLLPPALTAALAFRKRQPALIAAAALGVVALAPPIFYFHELTTARLEEISQVDGQLMPLRAVEHRNAENLRQIEEATKQIGALRGAYETKANWIAFFADLQERLTRIEDVWLDRLAVIRPAQAALSTDPREPNSPAEGEPAAEANPAAPPNAAPVRLTLSGRLLDVRNPQSRVSPQSLQRVKQLLASFSGSQFVAAVENERFDTTQNGLLRFDFTLVIAPRKTL